MKTKIVWSAALVLLITCGVYLSAFQPKGVEAAKSSEPVATTTVATSTPQLSHRQKAWLGALEWCESRGNPDAVNPKDRDNTPSYGILQFKPGTFSEFAKLYSIASTTDYMDPDAQEAIVTQMILRDGVDWHQQFPVCVHKLGTPPTI